MVERDGELEFVIKIWSQLEGHLFLVVGLEEFRKFTIEAIRDRGQETLSFL